ncbi:YitT family protein [Pediococcus cellicola]|nr:YitT family protein [Pediococcus cellicola]GEL15363.1 membrane protein [Pediococcus cellicola]
MNKRKFHWLIQLGLILIALEIIAISINMFYAPHNVASGGTTGIAILLHEAFGMNMSIVVLILNVAMLVLSYFTLDKATTARITFGSLFLPVCLALTPQIKLVDDRLLAVIIGGAIFAAGVALLYHIDASSGGTTVPPLIFKKYFNIKPAFGLLAIDGLVCFFNVFVSGFEAFFLAILSSVLTMFIMNYIETGLDRKKVIYVMSDGNLEDVKHSLVTIMEKGVTIFDVKGGYSGDQKQMLMLVVENAEYQHILNEIHAVAPDAFALVYNVAEVRGGNF